MLFRSLLEVWPLWTALVAAVLGALAVEWLRSRGRTTSDLALALCFYGGIALGVVLALLHRARGGGAQTVDTAARKAITDRMQQRFYESATYLVMWYQDKLQAYRTDTWTGWQEIPGGVIFNFTRDNYLTIQPAG